MVQDVTGARLLADPMRREILRLLAAKSLTGSELSKRLGLSPPSVSHHLRALERGGFISMVKAEPGEHGIVRKFFKPNAQVFLVDNTNHPLHMRRCFMPAEVERVRGLLASLTLAKDDTLSCSTELLEDLCERFSRALIQVAQKAPPNVDGDPEKVINHLYRGALRLLLYSDEGILPEGLRE